jgi:hypothetical protein
VVREDVGRLDQMVIDADEDEIFGSDFDTPGSDGRARTVEYDSSQREVNLFSRRGPILARKR